MAFVVRFLKSVKNAQIHIFANKVKNKHRNGYEKCWIVDKFVYNKSATTTFGTFTSMVFFFLNWFYWNVIALGVFEPGT